MSVQCTLVVFCDIVFMLCTSDLLLTFICRDVTYLCTLISYDQTGFWTGFSSFMCVSI